MGYGSPDTCCLCERECYPGDAQSPQMVRIMPCGHTTFCLQCITNWMTAGRGQRHTTCPMDREPITGLILVSTGESISLPCPATSALPQNLDACVQDLERDIDLLNGLWCQSWSCLAAGSYPEARRLIERFARSRMALDERKEEFRYEAFRALFSGQLSDRRIEEVMDSLESRRRVEPQPALETDKDVRVMRRYIAWLEHAPAKAGRRSGVSSTQAISCWAQHYGHVMGGEKIDYLSGVVA